MIVTEVAMETSRPMKERDVGVATESRSLPSAWLINNLPREGGARKSSLELYTD